MAAGTFTPPITHESSSDIFWGRYKIPVGVSVLWNGTTFVDTPYPWLGELVDLVEGVTWFQGGRTYHVSGETFDRLAAAGYEINVSGYGDDGYGEGEYGE